jgi:hypothetical protein
MTTRLDASCPLLDRRYGVAPGFENHLFVELFNNHNVQQNELLNTTLVQASFERVLPPAFFSD